MRYMYTAVLLCLLMCGDVAAQAYDRSEQDKRYCYQESLWDRHYALREAYPSVSPEGMLQDVPDWVMDESSRLIDEAMIIWWQLVDQRYTPFTRGREMPDCTQVKF